MNNKVILEKLKKKMHNAREYAMAEYMTTHNSTLQLYWLNKVSTYDHVLLLIEEMENECGTTLDKH